MQFEDFDKKVREAAEHHHPAYDEKAWDNMEHLLDKHLPVEKDNRRRIIFFLSLFLLTGISAYLWTTKPWKQSASVAESSKQTIAQPPASSSPASTDNADNKTENSKPEAETTSAKPGADGNITDKSEQTVYSTDETSSDKINLKTKKLQASLNQSGSKDNNLIVKRNNNKQDFTLVTASDNATSNKKNGNKRQKESKATVTTTDETIANEPPVNMDIVNSTPANDKPNTDAIKKTNAEPVAANPQAQPEDNKPAAAADSTVAKTDKEPVKNENKPAGTPVKKNKSSFAITVSGGPDVSTVGLNSLGKMNCVIGAGLSYTFNKFTVRSGFYAVKKVYTADPEDYHPPKHSLPSYLDLTRVDGDCKVYEIPVTFSYNFSQSKNYTWFGAIGLSSFLMKEEDYEYYYKDVNGNPAQRSWSTSNNKHLFSVLNLSAGYEKKLNNNLSFTTEPYFKLPLEGIGYGNIQLNSLGVLISLNIKPFAAKK